MFTMFALTNAVFALPLSLITMLVQPIGEGEAGETLLFKEMVRAEA